MDILQILLVTLIILIMLSWMYLLFTLQKKECSFNNKRNSVDLILPNLFLGNIESSIDKSFINKNKIKVIINCSNGIENKFENNKNIIYHRIPVDDSLLDYDINLMKDYLPKIVKIIDYHLTNNNVVLVHCYAGRQRSAIVIAAYLIYKYNYSIDEAYQYILSKRSEAFHYGTSINFHESLLDFKKKMNK